MMPDTDPTAGANPILRGLQDYASGGNAFGSLVGLGLAATGNGPGANPAMSTTDAAVANGMSQLADTMKTTGNDPSRAMLKFVGTPEGQAVMKVPGAFKRLTEEFQKSQTPLPMQGASVPGGSSGVIEQGGGRNTSFQAAPQVNSVPPGNQPVITRPGQNGRPGTAQTGTTNPTSEVQTFQGMAALSGLPQDTLGAMAGLNAGNNDLSRRFAMGGTLQGKLPGDVLQNWIYGFYNVMKDDKIPGRFYWTDVRDPTNVHPINANPSMAPSIAPTWNNGLQGTNPATINSSPTRMDTSAQPGPQGAVTPQSPEASKIANKYNVDSSAIKPNGMIDPVKAWGPGAIYALGGGLPAMVQNTAGTIGQWFDPRGGDQSVQQVQQAEQGLQALQYLSTTLAEGSRVRIMVEAALGMGPEHEKWNSPQYAAGQLITMRNTLEGEAKVEQDAVSTMLAQGTQADNSVISDGYKKLFAINKVLAALPSTEALQSEKQAIRDGKLENVPSFASAANTVGSTVGTAVSHGMDAAIPNKVGQMNADVEGTMQRIQAARTPKELMPYARVYQQLDPTLQEALKAKRDEFRKGVSPKKPMTGPMTGNSGVQMPPAQGTGNPMYNAQPANPFTGLEGP